MRPEATITFIPCSFARRSWYSTASLGSCSNSLTMVPSQSVTTALTGQLFCGINCAICSRCAALQAAITSSWVPAVTIKRLLWQNRSVAMPDTFAIASSRSPAHAAGNGHFSAWSSLCGSVTACAANPPRCEGYTTNCTRGSCLAARFQGANCGKTAMPPCILASAASTSALARASP